MYGFVDLGTGINIDTDELPHATYALVFLAVGLNEHWKIPIGYFLINSLNGSERGNLLQKSLELMHETGAKVHSIIFDGAHTNTAMCKHLGANFSTSESRFFIEHPVSKEPVFIFYDACYMLKLIRNTFGDKNEKINWEYIKKLYDKENNEGLKLATKLSSRHIFYFNEKMNIKLAAQVMSNSVSNALKCCDHLGDSDFKGSQGTAEFCGLVNNAFDIMNCRTKFSKNPYNLCLDINTINKYREFTETFEKYIFNLKFQNGQRIIDSNRKTGFIGLVYGLKNLLNLYEYLNSKYGLNYLLSYKLSQDHIETFFSAVRMRGGHNNNPTCKQFFTAYKKLLVHNQATGPQYENCLAMLDPTPTELSVVNVGPDSITSQINETDEAIVVEHDHSYFQTLNRLSSLVENISEYIGGFVVKKILKKFIMVNQKS